MGCAPQHQGLGQKTEGVQQLPGMVTTASEISQERHLPSPGTTDTETKELELQSLSLNCLP